MARAAIDALLYLLDEAFEANGEHSLLANLQTVREDDWRWTPPGGARTIRAIAEHVGECKYVYESHAFGDGSLRWDQPAFSKSVAALPRGAGPDDIVRWLRAGHDVFRSSVAALADDEELVRPRRLNWGETAETRWIISVMIDHDLYHAGEINHIRALRQGSDRWPWESASRD